MLSSFDFAGPHAFVMRRMRLGLATRRRLYSATPVVRAETGVQLEGPPEVPSGPMEPTQRIRFPDCISVKGSF